MVNIPITNYVQRACLSVSTTFIVLPILAFTLRVLARRAAKRPLRDNDYYSLLATIFAVALQCCSIVAVAAGGLGYGHATEIVARFGPGPLTLLLKLLIPLQFFWVLSLSFSKSSILLLYMDLFQAERYIVVASRLTISVIVAWTLGTILAGCFICIPFSMNWDPTAVGGHCGDQVLSFIITGVVNLITDLIVIILPQWRFFTLQMALSHRLTLIAVFSLGFLTCVVSAIRLVSLVQMDFADIPDSMPLANIFSGLEPSMAVTLSCVPMLQPLLKRRGQSSSKGVTGSSEFSGSGKRHFAPLADDIQLRPFGPANDANITAGPASGTTDERTIMESYTEDENPIREESETKGQIRVKTKWEVS